MQELNSIIDRISPSFILGFSLTVSTIILSLVYTYMYEQLHPTKDRLEPLFVLAGQLLLLISSTLEYGYVLYINQITFLPVDSEVLLKTLLTFNFTFYAIHYSVITKHLVNTLEAPFLETVNVFIYIIFLFGMFILPASYSFYLFLLLSLFLHIHNLVYLFFTFRSKCFSLALILLTMATLFLYAGRIGFLFGLSFNSFLVLYYFNIYKWILLLIYPIVSSLLFLSFNFLVINSYTKNVDLKNKKNRIRLNRIKLKEKRFLAW